MSALLAGQGVNEVARQYHLHPSTVSRIKAKLQPGELQQVAIEKREGMADLITGCLQESLRAMNAIAKQAQDAGYTSGQAANELAVLYGVIADKTIRIFEAAQSGEPDAGSNEPGA